MFKFLLLISSLLLISTANAYNPPIGIPAPSFGIDEVAPSAPTQWPNTEATGYYYVDNTNQNATDIGNTYGYPNKPRMTIPTVPFSAGTYIEINGGPYTTTISPVFNCTKLAPCWLRGGDTNNKTIFKGAVNAPASISILNSSYLIIENLDLNGGYGGFGIGGANTHHISIRNSSVRNKPFPGKNTAALGIGAARGGTTRDIVIYNMTFSSLGNWQTSVDEDYHAVLPSLWGKDSTTSVNNIWFLDSNCVNISGNCIQVNAGNWTNSYQYLHHIYIGRNTGSYSRQAPFGFKQSSDIILSENTSFGIRQQGSQPGDGITYQYRPNNLWIIYNHIHDTNFGIRQSDSAWSSPSNTSYIVGNVIHNIHPVAGAPYNPNDQWRVGTAISFWKGQMNRYVVDNTIYDVHNGIISIENGPIHMSGNLISNIDAAGAFLDVTFSARNGVASFDYSLLDDTEGDFRIDWNWQTYSNLVSFQQASSQCASCIQGNPAFVGPTATPIDLSISTGSAAAGTNNDLNNPNNNTPNVYAIFKNLYGIDIQVDKNYKVRPNIGRSIGAYEGAGGTTPPVNNPPVANHGGPYSGVVGTAVTFNGSGSTDPDNDPLTYSWTVQNNGTATGVSPSFTFSTVGTYNVSLQVNDGQVNSPQVNTTVTISANTTPPPANRAPTANPGGPYSGVVGTAVTFNGSGSTDPDNDPLTYSWEIQNNGMATGVTPSVTFANVGTYKVWLQVNDGKLSSSWVNTTVTIKAKPTPPANRAPTANPGGPYSGIVGKRIYFLGAGSTDPDNDPLTYKWEVQNNGFATGIEPSFIFTSPGTYKVWLQVNDGKLSSSWVNTTVTIIR